MHTTIILIHVIAMVVSAALMSGAIAAGLFGKPVAARMASVGMAVTIAGVSSGAMLLLAHPLSLQCAMLTAYLVAVSALYIYGFGTGNARQARLIRVKS